MDAFCQKGIEHTLGHIGDSPDFVASGIGWTMDRVIQILLVITIIVLVVRPIQGRG
jgi:hypothetical protein